MDEDMARATILEAASVNLESCQRAVAQVAIEILDEGEEDEEGDFVRVPRESWNELRDAAAEWKNASEVFRRAVSVTIPKKG